jgi:SAM-dependent methyltransferase
MPSRLSRYRLASRLKQLVYIPADTYDLLAGRRPPTYKLLVGDGSWRATGSEFLRLFVTPGGLRGEDHVLDVGCGIGRIASALTRYLNKDATYHGFDIVKEEIEWCTQSISQRFPIFSFSWADIRNAHYNPQGTIAASEYQFPFPDGYFDFVYLTSVFTHMLPPDLEHYLSEISRVLRPGGRLFLTCFLINDTSLRRISEKRSFLGFQKTSSEAWVMDVGDPEAAVAYPEEYLREQIGSARISTREPIRYGAWSGGRRYLSFQDIVVAEKEGV